MAVRDDFSAGEVLAAADLNDTFASKAAYPSGGSDGQALVKSGTGAAWSDIFPEALSDSVATLQTTTSTTYTDLATAGPAVTITTGTKALVIISAELNGSANAVSTRASFEVSGATTISASDSSVVMTWGNNSRVQIGASRVTLLTGLTAGSNTFTMKYKVSSGSGAFFNRSITVINLGS